MVWSLFFASPALGWLSSLRCLSEFYHEMGPITPPLMSVLRRGNTLRLVCLCNHVTTSAQAQIWIFMWALWTSWVIWARLRGVLTALRKAVKQVFLAAYLRPIDRACRWSDNNTGLNALPPNSSTPSGPVAWRSGLYSRALRRASRWLISRLQATGESFAPWQLKESCQNKQIRELGAEERDNAPR